MSIVTAIYRLYKIVDRKLLVIGLVLFFILIIVLIFTFGFFVGYSSDRPLRITSQVLSPSAVPVSSPEAATSENEVYLVPENIPTEWQEISLVSDGYVNETDAKVKNTSQYLFPPRQTFSSPSLMSDFDFVSIHNYDGAELQNQGFGKMDLSVASFNYREPFNTDYSQGVVYSDGNGYWLSGQGLTRESYPFGTSNSPKIFAHGSSVGKLKELMEVLGKFKYQDVPPDEKRTLPVSTISEFNAPNGIDKTGTYRYYVSQGYSRLSPQDKWRENMEEWEERSGEIICLAFKNIAHEPCRFSTSDCTCCNTGCELLDLVFYTDYSKNLVIEPIYQKGKGISAGARFVYKSEHPYLYYSASFSSPLNSQKDGVLDLINTVNSIQKVE
ncbi:hypothetical protein A2961_01875 [Candidatus Woesebacteria bacterium RIFCSPLOWO2_01_FULL_39_21]|uniref:Uncharacterized protein n=1 Tax=Candidatus Woesebacteria bacterium RIFCSPLOWO2_01_FULL_39_21 TaxID=1802519 RepID=A0A1F8BJI8_9BACT|nr:MAG: hypothetical protein A2691_01620 [Candidatus Woesebacteria bacterium RIFCSPHIGHO2_01_FULL_39_23]OGM63505.1 MAG: hypothetical protein A2961_01875 [Candidatus Woesebacteria bacterium RIFCSPLOWO2_01_FULL_39_21]